MLSSLTGVGAAEFDRVMSFEAASLTGVGATEFDRVMSFEAASSTHTGRFCAHGCFSLLGFPKDAFTMPRQIRSVFVS
jgi:hypothetical protein